MTRRSTRLRCATLLCWGAACSDPPIELGRPAPDRPDVVVFEEPELPGLVQVAMSPTRVCTVDETGRAQCTRDAPPPAVPLWDLSLSRHGGCGLRADGQAECWGDETSVGAHAPPDVPFEVVATGRGFACGLHTSMVTCWGLMDPTLQAIFEEPEALQIAAGSGFVCALRTESTVDCFSGQVHEPWDAEGVTRLFDGALGVLATLEDGRILRHREGLLFGSASLPVDRYLAVSTHEDRACGLTEEGQVICTGDPPVDRALDLAGGLEVCAISMGGELTCWNH